jgi:hypothetical protein
VLAVCWTLRLADGFAVCVLYWCLLPQAEAEARGWERAAGAAEDDVLLDTWRSESCLPSPEALPRRLSGGGGGASEGGGGGSSRGGGGRRGGGGSSGDCEAASCSGGGAVAAGAGGPSVSPEALDKRFSRSASLRRQLDAAVSRHSSAESRCGCEEAVRGSTSAVRVRWFSLQPFSHALTCAEGGEVLPLPVFPYRRLRIQGDQGRGVRIQVHCISITFVNSKILLLILRACKN